MSTLFVHPFPPSQFKTQVHQPLFVLVVDSSGRKLPVKDDTRPPTPPLVKRFHPENLGLNFGPELLLLLGLIHVGPVKRGMIGPPTPPP